MVKSKILCVIVSAVMLVAVLCVPVAAEGSYTEYYEYSGTAISATTANILEGYALNYMRTYDDDYNYWAACRISQYEYLLVCFKSLDDFVFDKTAFTAEALSGNGFIYNERLASYSDSIRTYYQAGLSPTVISAPIRLQLTRGYVIGNINNSIAVNPEHETVLNHKYIQYILYTLIVFLLLFVAFKFLNKRWLLP